MNVELWALSSNPDASEAENIVGREPFERIQSSKLRFVPTRQERKFGQVKRLAALSGWPPFEDYYLKVRFAGQGRSRSRGIGALGGCWTLIQLF
ncbi:hypothetical protein, partial [Roseovarius aestuarii]